MKKPILVTYIFWITAAFFLGILTGKNLLPLDSAGPNHLPNEITISHCEAGYTHYKECFGRGTGIQKILESDSASLWALPSKDNQVRYGILNKAKEQAYEILIQLI